MIFFLSCLFLYTLGFPLLFIAFIEQKRFFFRYYTFCHSVSLLLSITCLPDQRHTIPFFFYSIFTLLFFRLTLFEYSIRFLCSCLFILYPSSEVIVGYLWIDILKLVPNFLRCFYPKELPTWAEFVSILPKNIIPTFLMFCIFEKEDFYASILSAAICYIFWGKTLSLFLTIPKN